MATSTEVKFYQQDASVTEKGAINFKTNGGITVGTGTDATEFASKVILKEALTDGTQIATIDINGSDTSLYAPTPITYSAGTKIEIKNGSINNMGVIGISTGTSQGTISVNAGGSTQDVKVNGLGTAAYKASNDFAPANHGTHVTYYSQTPTMNGTTGTPAGTSSTVARGDHIHPSDTSRAPVVHAHSAADITSGELDTTRLPILKQDNAGPSITHDDSKIPTLGTLNKFAGHIAYGYLKDNWKESSSSYLTNRVMITDDRGKITGAEYLDIARGGTGATSAAAARTALGAASGDSNGIAYKADRANKIITTSGIGSDSVPVYVNSAGEIKSCSTPITVGAVMLANSKGNINAGSEFGPVYFYEGEPRRCIVSKICIKDEQNPSGVDIDAFENNQDYIYACFVTIQEDEDDNTYSFILPVSSENIEKDYISVNTVTGKYDFKYNNGSIYVITPTTSTFKDLQGVEEITRFSGFPLMPLK